MKKIGLTLGMVCVVTALFCEGDIKSLQLTVEPGPHWKGEGKVMLFFPIEVEPSFVWWLEDGQDNYMETIYLSGKIAKGTWRSTTGRPEALPVWGHSRGKRNEHGDLLPSEEQPFVDGQSSATPMETFICFWDGVEALPPGEYHLYFEINIAFDYNDVWKKRVSKENRKFKNGVNGQPSLVYQAVLKVNEDIEITQFELMGTGAPLGSDGDLHPVVGIDTALNIMSTLRLSSLSY